MWTTLERTFKKHLLLEVRLGRQDQPKSGSRKVQGDWRIMRRKGLQKKG